MRASLARLARASQVKMREMPMAQMGVQEYNPPVAKNAALAALLVGSVGGIYYFTMQRMQTQVRVLRNATQAKRRYSSCIFSFHRIRWPLLKTK